MRQIKRSWECPFTKEFKRLRSPEDDFKSMNRTTKPSLNVTQASGGRSPFSAQGPQLY